METNPAQPNISESKSHLRNIDWGITPPLEARRIMASEFETFIVSLMGSGKITAEEAQNLAGRFVEICKPANSYPTLEQAMQTLKNSDNVVLVQFSLKLEEAKLRNASTTLYQSLVDFVHKNPNNLATVPDITQQFENNTLTTRAAVLNAMNTVEMGVEVENTAQALEKAGFKEQAFNLRKAYTENRITSSADLSSWQTLLQSKRLINTAPNIMPKDNLAQSPTNPVWEGIVSLDRKLHAAIRKGIGNLFH